MACESSAEWPLTAWLGGAGFCLADSPETAWAEWYRALAELGLRPEQQLPRNLWKLRVDIERVADCQQEPKSASLSGSGRGYPDRLAGEDIPLESRIIGRCDSWNAMRTDRAYRRALSQEVARAELVANAGHQFDPKIVAALLEVIERASGTAPVPTGEGTALTPGPTPVQG